MGTKFGRYIFAILILFFSLSARAADVYITQTASGGDTGADCANAKSVTYFNASATGGNTYHLCGTFTGSTGGGMLTVPTGSAGNILTVKFEDNSVMTAPYWSASTGAIYINGKSYVTIDGGTNGVIKNSANGTSKTYKVDSRAVFITGSNHVTVKNLTIQDIYNKVGSTNNGNATGIRMEGSNSNILIDNNVVSAAMETISVKFEGGTLSDLEIKNNTVSDSCHMIVVAGGASQSTATNILIHNNEVYDWSNWWSPANGCHTDGIFVFLWEGNTSSMTADIYNNYVHGGLWDQVNPDSSPTAHIFCTYGQSGGGTNGAACNIYNNISVDSAMTAIWAKKTSSVRHRIYNNTIVNSPYGVIFENATAATFQNNLLKNTQYAFKSYGTLENNIAASDYNLFDNTGATWFAVTDAGQYNTYAQWRAKVPGYDANSVNAAGSAGLNADYTLQASSLAIDNGMDLSAYFTTDYAGNTRSTFDIGAYEYNGVDATPSPFSFTDVTGALQSTVTTTDPCMTVAGIDAGQTPAISISGAGCTYNIDAGAYTSDAGTVGLDNVVCLRGTSSASYSTTYPSCTLTIGGVSDSGAPWTVTTEAAIEDIVPPTPPRMRAVQISGSWR